MGYYGICVEKMEGGKNSTTWGVEHDPKRNMEMGRWSPFQKINKKKRRPAWIRSLFLKVAVTCLTKS